MRSVGRRPCWSAALDFALLPLPLHLALLLVEAATLFSLVGYSTPAWASQCASYVARLRSVAAAGTPAPVHMRDAVHEILHAWYDEAIACSDRERLGDRGS